MQRGVLTAAIAGAMSVSFLLAETQAAPDFEKELVPILEEACLFCHNKDEAKGGLSMATFTDAMGFENLIVPGNAGASVLMEVISGEEPEMPEKGEPLTAAQVAVLEAWIEGGAKWPEDRHLVYNPKRDFNWWSLKPMVATKAFEKSVHLVDFFVDAGLREKGLEPVAEADPQTLIRRLSYDLTGLPPRPNEIEAFLEQSSQDPELAWASLVDRLLASPAFGEKFAQHWLDLARYAETHGYDKDKPRNDAWPYRDYVIRSFNQDKAYSTFVQEQVAGDVLFPGPEDGVTALGFLAAGPWDFIGHVEVGEAKLDGRIAKHLDRDEMVSAVFNVFQSTTVQCAQCHHHKFDPIRMEDYYRLHAVFSAVDRASRVYGGLTPEQLERRSALDRRITELKSEQSRLSNEAKQRSAAKTSGLDRRIAMLREKYGTGNAQRPQFGYHSKIERSSSTEKWVQVDLGKPRGATQIKLIPAFDQFGGIGEGFGFPVR